MDIEKYGTGFIRIRKKLNELKTATYKISEIGDFVKIELIDTRSYDVENDVFKGPYLSVQLPFQKGVGRPDYFTDVPMVFSPRIHVL